MPRFVAIGEIMVEMASAEGGLYAMGYAGDTFNTAWYARQLLPSDWQVGYVSRVGTDAVSDGMLRFVQDQGVDTAGMARDPARTVGLYMISLTDGERSFSYWRGQSAAKGLADDPDWLAAQVAEADVIYLSGITLAILSPEAREVLCAAVAARRAEGALVAFDTNLRLRLWENAEAARTGLVLGASCADIVLPSFDEEQDLFGDATQDDTFARYTAAGARTVAVKNGGEAVKVWHEGTVETFDTPAAEQIDSTAAGDSFGAGFVAARATGLSIAEATAQAQRLAARVIGARGALVPGAAVQAT